MPKLYQLSGYIGYAMDELGNVYALPRLHAGKSSSYRHKSLTKLKPDYSTKGSPRYTLYQKGKRLRRSRDTLLKSLDLSVVIEIK